MRNDLVEIVVVSDRSGSMEDILHQAQSGINELIITQKLQPGEARLTLVEFDHEQNLVYNGINIKDVGEYKLVPRGTTRLLDAVGSTIDTVGRRLSQTPENDRPGLVIFIISTDGFENASKEYTYKKVQDMIDHQSSKYNWQFEFMGCGTDVFKQGLDLGMDKDYTTGVAPSKVHKYYQTISGKISGSRVMMSSGATLDSVCDNLAFTDQERQDLSQDDN